MPKYIYRIFIHHLNPVKSRKENNIDLITWVK